MTLLLTRPRALLLFYRGIAPFTVVLSALILGLVLLPLVQEGRAVGLLPRLLLVKLLTWPVVWYLAEQMRPNQYWFFYNLGIARGRLWAGVVLLDGLIFLGLAAGLRAVLA